MPASSAMSLNCSAGMAVAGVGPANVTAPITKNQRMEAISSSNRKHSINVASRTSPMASQTQGACLTNAQARPTFYEIAYAK